MTAWCCRFSACTRNKSSDERSHHYITENLFQAPNILTCVVKVNLFYTYWCIIKHPHDTYILHTQAIVFKCHCYTCCIYMCHCLNDSPSYTHFILQVYRIIYLKSFIFFFLKLQSLGCIGVWDAASRHVVKEGKNLQLRNYRHPLLERFCITVCSQIIK